METLLCRRFELARAGGDTLETVDAALKEHVVNCESCHNDYMLEQRIAAALSMDHAHLPDGTRRRIEAIVSLKAGEVRAPSLSTVLAVAVAIAATVTIALLLPDVLHATTAPEAGPEIAELGPSVAITSPVSTIDEPFRGMALLIKRHNAGPSAPDVPPVGLLYEAKLPYALASQLLSSQDAVMTSWDGMPPAQEVNDATLFVLDRRRIVMDPVIGEVLAEAGTLTLPQGPHQITLAGRDQRLFVIVADPAGVETVAGAFY